MDFIKYHADEFLKQYEFKEKRFIVFLEEINFHLNYYKKGVQKIFFLEHIFMVEKIKYERHLKFCSESSHNNCRITKYFEMELFFLQNEIDFLESKLNAKYLKKNERTGINIELDYFIGTLYQASFQDKNNYLILKKELEEMKHYYYLDKKNWRHLFIGKITELVTKNILSAEISKNLIEIIDDVYTLKINNYMN